MTRLDTALTAARAALSPEAQDGLAALIETYVATHASDPDFTDAELAELRRRHDEPFDPAPEAEVREFFARHRR
ncbi:MAG: hypothetical protein QM699_14595 [Amaricoccus sp.]|uniref:hypothetical protein n=1 Tax=Amaricoccus sp. TaxID=1872485 RepID=UPI0039E387A4